jgi:hypothetical protein
VKSNEPEDLQPTPDLELRPLGRGGEEHLLQMSRHERLHQRKETGVAMNLIYELNRAIVKGMMWTIAIAFFIMNLPWILLHKNSWLAFYEQEKKDEPEMMAYADMIQQKLYGRWLKDSPYRTDFELEKPKGRFE